MAQFTLHILAAFGTPVPHPLALRPGDNCVLGHRIICDPAELTEDEITALEESGVPTPPWPLLANGQEFTKGLEVDASFVQGGGLFLDVANVRCTSGVTKVYFRWPTTFPDHHVMSLLSTYGYQVIDDAESIVGHLPDFFPGIQV